MTTFSFILALIIVFSNWVPNKLKVLVQVSSVTCFNLTVQVSIKLKNMSHRLEH